MGKNIDYMMELVKDYLEGNKARVTFEQDFQYEILERYRKMAKEDQKFAEFFYDMISEEGVDVGGLLSDEEFHELINRRFREVKSFYSADIL